MITFLNKSEIPVLTEVDTRAARELKRNHGGIITDQLKNMDRLIQKLKKVRDLSGDVVRYVTRKT